MRAISVERRDVTQGRAACALKLLGVTLRDLFQRFQAIGGETRTDRIQRLHAATRQSFDHQIGVGRKPLRAADSRLERQRSEERRVGKECVSTCSSRVSQYT